MEQNPEFQKELKVMSQFQKGEIDVVCDSKKDVDDFYSLCWQHRIINFRKALVDDRYYCHCERNPFICDRTCTITYLEFMSLYAQQIKERGLEDEEHTCRFE